VTDAHFTPAVLEERCDFYRGLFLDDGTATDADLAPYWPGGEENAHEGLDGWIVAYGRCLWALGRAIGREAARETSTVMDARQAEVFRALRADPERVELMSLTLADGTEHTPVVQVYPKSALALEHIGAANLLIAYLCDQLEVLERHGTSEDLEVMVAAREKRGYLERLASWIATTPGPGLPYEEGEREPSLPLAIRDLSPFDFYMIATAFQRVNGNRLRALEASGTSRSRPDWGGFFVGVASELGVAVSTLLRDQSLAEVVATASERARIHAEAKERAASERAPTTVPG